MSMRSHIQNTGDSLKRDSHSFLSMLTQLIEIIFRIELSKRVPCLGIDEKEEKSDAATTVTPAT